MSRRPTAPAERPPDGIIGLDPRWSRLVVTPELDGVGRGWHLLDSWAGRENGQAAALTLLCVHGNPSWSFLWRKLIADVDQAMGDTVRVIAVDQLDMGYSERTGLKRPLATRIDDLCALTAELALAGPVVTVAHDWGGPISLGWALRHLPGQDADPDAAKPASSLTSTAVLAGVVLTNTAVHQPVSSRAPAVIRFIRSAPVLKASTLYSRAFIHGAIEMSRPRLSAKVRAGFMAPYRHWRRRAAIADFVADIPLDPEHESAATLAGIASGLARLERVPALLLWGPRDKVFSDLYLHDLEKRLPHADVHRFPTAAHFVAEDADVAGAVVAWLGTLPCAGLQMQDDVEASRDTQKHSTDKPSEAAPAERRALTDFSLADPATNAVVESGPHQRALTFAELAGRIEQLASGMAAFGIRPGDKVAVMVLPGVDLALAVYGCWRLGATLVLVDAGLGPRGMQQALQAANPAWLIGIDKALVAAKVLGWPGRRISVKPRASWFSRALGIQTDLQTLMHQGATLPDVSLPEPDMMAAIVFTSGSTGPSKGVIYRHHQLEAQRDALMSLYDISADDCLVAAFAPFALYGPTMCISSIVPSMNVAAPATLTAAALADAVALLGATLVFASPAALVNVMATRDSCKPAQLAAVESVRLVLSAGAPVRAELLAATATLFPRADFRTPYGMTEMLPVADVSLQALRQLEPGGGDASSVKTSAAGASGDGVCVGHPLAGVSLMIDPLDALGRPIDALSSAAGLLGEIVVRAAHARDGYHRLWFTEHQASQPAGWHRTGDIGSLDASGRLWVGGRLGHVITTPAGPVAPVRSEQSIEMLAAVAMAAVVGVGPVGKQVIVAVIQGTNVQALKEGATLTLIDQIRGVVDPGIDIAAVLVANKLPVDRRHNSKIDRSAIADWATKLLAGERVRAL